MDFCMSLAAQLMLDEIEKGSSSLMAKNVVLSPMSIAIVLNMVASGSQGQTLKQFLHFLGAQGIEELSSNTRAMMSLLTASSGDNGGTAEEDSKTALVPEEKLNFGHRTGEMPPLGASSSKGSGTAKDNARRSPYGMPLLPFGDRLQRGPIISFANALWVDHRCPLKPSFTEITDSVYKALVKNVDLVSEVMFYNLTAFFLSFFLSIIYFRKV